VQSEAANCWQNEQMPNIAAVLKVEIARVARKELRAQTDSLKKSLASYRAEIAALKKRVKELESGLRRAATAARKAPAQSPKRAAGKEGTSLRFRAAGMAANRKRLGLSAADFGLLVGATGQSIYAWESGKAKPRPQNLAAIAALRGVGKTEVAAKLEALRAA
jgi:DNA-binding transcriptional regulator YiaG